MTGIKTPYLSVIIKFISTNFFCQYQQIYYLSYFHTGLYEKQTYNPQIQISEKSQTKRIEIADSRKTKRPKIDKRTTHNKRHSNAIITL